MDDNALIVFLEGLTPADFNRLLLRLPGTANYIPDNGPHLSRVAALIAYVRSSTGPGMPNLSSVVRSLFPHAGAVPTSSLIGNTPSENTPSMTDALQRADINRIARVIDSLPHPNGLRNSFELWLFDSPNVQDVLGSISFSGGTQDAARNAILALHKRGRYQEDRSYLHDLVTALIDHISSLDDQIALRDIANRIAPSGAPPPPVASPTLSPGLYKGRDARETTRLEEVVGENTLKPYYYLQLGAEAGKAVCLLRLPEWVGTGFLIARNLIMTNNHVLSDAGLLKDVEALFRYEKTPNNNDVPVIVARADAKGLFRTNAEQLDATIFTIDDAAAARLEKEQIRPLTLSRRAIAEKERVAIIQHAGGRHKQVSLQNNKVQYADADIVDYTTTTLPGSSGSPVFDDDFRVVSLHRESVANDQGIFYRNRGTSMRALLQWLIQQGVVNQLKIAD